MQVGQDRGASTVVAGVKRKAGLEVRVNGVAVCVLQGVCLNLLAETDTAPLVAT